MSYITHLFSLTENQKKKLARAYNKNKAINIKFKTNGLSEGSDPKITRTKNNRVMERTVCKSCGSYKYRFIKGR